MKAIEQYFHVVLFMMLSKLFQVLTLWLNPNESYQAILSI